MRLIGLAVFLSLVLAPLDGEAQAGKVYRIGYLDQGSSAHNRPYLERSRKDNTHRHRVFGRSGREQNDRQPCSACSTNTANSCGQHSDSPAPSPIL
jgi:hypothetical protein